MVLPPKDHPFVAAEFDRHLFDVERDVGAQVVVAIVVVARARRSSDAETRHLAATGPPRGDDQGGIQNPMLLLAIGAVLVGAPQGNPPKPVFLPGPGRRRPTRRSLLSESLYGLLHVVVVEPLAPTVAHMNLEALGKHAPGRFLEALGVHEPWHGSQLATRRLYTRGR